MKKIIYSIIFCAGALAGNSVNAQTATFTVPSDTVELAIYTSINAHSDITNTTSSNIKIEWKVTDHNFPASWAEASRLGICDNVLCRLNANNQLLDGSTYTTNDYAPNTPDDFHFQMTDYDAADAGTYYAKVNFKDAGSSYETDVVFLFHKWTTSVNSVASASQDNIKLYPNPARDVLNISYSKKINVDNIAIYNLVGKQVTNNKVSGNTAKINIEDIPSGIYFVRLMDNSGRVVATRRFTHR